MARALHRWLGASAAILLGFTPLTAHHAIGAKFDSTKPLTLRVSTAVPAALARRANIASQAPAATAAVCSSAVWPSILITSGTESAVSGLTKQEAASRALTPSGLTSASAARTTRYGAYMAPPRIPTVLPSKA